MGVDLLLLQGTADRRRVVGQCALAHQLGHGLDLGGEHPVPIVRAGRRARSRR